MTRRIREKGKNPTIILDDWIIRKYMKIIYITIATIVSTILILTTPVFADSSWVWISETRPYDVLPYVIVLTLAIEILAINCLSGVNKKWKAMVVIALANLCSFMIPYLVAVFVNDVHIYPETLNDYHSIVIGPYLVLTLLVEVPLVMSLLNKDVESRYKLFWVTVGSNVITTMIVYIIEQVFCEGYYA